MDTKKSNKKTEARKRALTAEKYSWIEALGSDDLKRLHSAGYDCERMYLAERAALDYPSFVVDYDDNSVWKSISCPSIEMLDMVDEIVGEHYYHHLQKILIVWLTTDPEGKSVGRETIIVLDIIYGGHWLVR